MVKHLKLHARSISVPTLLFITVLAISNTSFAQETYLFKEALTIQVPHNYGREAIYTDELLWEFYNSTLPAPGDGQPLSPEMKSSRWTTVKADTTGFLRIDDNAASTSRGPNHPPGPGRLDTSGNTNRNNRRRIGPSYVYLTYQSAKTQDALLNIRGNSAVLVNGKLHAGDPYRMGWLGIPVQLKQGLNEFFVRGNLVAANLHFPNTPIYLSIEDPTLPDVVQGKDKEKLIAGIVVINTSSKSINDLHISSIIRGKESSIAVPQIPPHSTRKVAVPINASNVVELGEETANLSLKRKNRTIDEQTINLRSVDANTPYRVTFISSIDGSVQYYAVNPEEGGERPGNALFFSVHGAGVEALGQAQAYEAKNWGTLVAPTNRRPRGFNWEDWGRLDALEVLDIAKHTLKPDTQQIYLTGHSMGGHGTWFLGATYPDKWAAIAPCAGYPTLQGYGSADGLIPQNSSNDLEKTLLRSSNQSNVIAYAGNYKPLGVYILHGDADRVVSVEYARQMKKVLSEFHPDFSYYEYPGGSHWYSNESVDWKPLFDYFKWHKRKAAPEVNHIDFTTSNPGISASYYWATIYQQEQALEYSNVSLDRDIDNGRITGTTKNTELLVLDLSDFSGDRSVNIQLDSLNELNYAIPSERQLLYLHKRNNNWEIVTKPSPSQKGPHRNGSFKEAFNHNMVYVYGTKGLREENEWAIEKANFDAESWYYRGNGAFDIVADHAFDPQAYQDRNIILIGNAETNSAWKKLLTDCPISVDKTGIQIGEKRYEGRDLGGYFTWKKPGSDNLTIGAITGAGITGMQAASANQYFAGASGFPDYMFFKLDMLKTGSDSVIAAGFYSNSWQIE